MTTLNNQINKLLCLPQPEQRSKEWFESRENKLTSSDAATALGLSPYQTRTNLIFKKCGHDPKPFVSNVATLHGQRYEDYAIEKYCRAMGKVNYNFGLINYADVHGCGKHDWLAGSPDGIAIDRDDPENSEPVLLEIKCPFRRKLVPNEIPVYYYPQVQLNLLICGLRIADFVEYKTATHYQEEEINIVRIYKDDKWLNNNLPSLELFWNEVLEYRQKGIETHPNYNIKSTKT